MISGMHHVIIMIIIVMRCFRYLLPSVTTSVLLQDAQRGREEGGKGRRGKGGKGKTQERRNEGREQLKADRKRNGREAARNLGSPPLLNEKFLLL